MSMLTTDFYEVLDNSLLKPYFKGVFASDQIPSVLKVDHFIICNTDKSDSSGSHWFLIHRPSLKTIECFDSLGISEIKKQFLVSTFSLKSVEKIKFNVTRVQPDNSDSCGKFCLYFIFHRMFNRDIGFSELMNEIFDHETLQNERKVNEFYDDVILNRSDVH